MDLLLGWEFSNFLYTLKIENSRELLFIWVILINTYHMEIKTVNVLFIHFKMTTTIQ